MAETSSGADAAVVDARHTETGVPDSLADNVSSHILAGRVEEVAGRRSVGHVDHETEEKPQTWGSWTVACDKWADMVVAYVRLLP